MPDEKLDPEWIISKLRHWLVQYANMAGPGWHVEISATYRPSDGSGGGVTFTVGTRPAKSEGKTPAAPPWRKLRFDATE
jgi:hypothetical protein